MAKVEDMSGAKVEDATVEDISRPQLKMEDRSSFGSDRFGFGKKETEF